MNYLGHAYLSFNIPEIIVGNMISDFVKGKARFGYTVGIQQGIMLHREIDNYTDNHPAIKEAKAVFRSVYRLYSSPIVDVALDHFLANDSTIFNNNTLFDFSQTIYTILDAHTSHLPQNFHYLYKHMRANNWLFHYKTKEGISNSIKSLINRAKFISNHQPALTILEQEYRFLEACYNTFIIDVKSFAKSQLNEHY